jgi:acetyl esterase/lipase
MRGLSVKTISFWRAGEVALILAMGAGLAAAQTGTNSAVVPAMPAPSSVSATGANPTVSPAVDSGPVTEEKNGLIAIHNVVTGTGGGRDLHAEILMPKAPAGPMPAVIWIHGGGWIGGSYKSFWATQFLARQGYFCASIEYRLDNEAKWPAQIEDCKLGVRWLRANAAKYNVDPNRIASAGDSAGGHLSACLGTMADEKEFEGDGGYAGVSSAVQAVVDFYGPTDFYDPGNYSAQAMALTEGLFGVPQAQDPALWKSGSPLAYVKAGDPPMLMIHGDADTLVPLAQSTVFQAALTKADVPNQLVVVKNGTHGLRPMPGTKIDPDWNSIHATMAAFLDKYLKGP